MPVWMLPVGTLLPVIVINYNCLQNNPKTQSARTSRWWRHCRKRVSIVRYWAAAMSWLCVSWCAGTWASVAETTTTCAPSVATRWTCAWQPAPATSDRTAQAAAARPPMKPATRRRTSETEAPPCGRVRPSSVERRRGVFLAAESDWTNLSIKTVRRLPSLSTRS